MGRVYGYGNGLVRPGQRDRDGPVRTTREPPARDGQRHWPQRRSQASSRALDLRVILFRLVLRSLSSTIDERPLRTDLTMTRSDSVAKHSSTGRPR